MAGLASSAAQKAVASIAESGSMRALKIEAEGIITSFRYPHFTWGTHPSFPMPPPATIYGHICSAVGDLIDPTSVRFAYRFTSEAQVEDLEHILVYSQTDKRYQANPFRRMLLFRPRLTLYVDRVDLLPAFRSPRYAVVLGRSQDLFTYSRVEEVELVAEPSAFYEHTLLPYTMAARAMQGTVVLMPRYVDAEQRRQATFERYLMLQTRITAGADSKGDTMRFAADGDAVHWVDPADRDRNGVGRGVLWHTFVDRVDASQ